MRRQSVLFIAIVALVAGILLPGRPARASAPIPNLATLSAGSGSTCAITTTGGTKCWGLNDAGQLGNGTTTSTNAPPATSVSGFATVVTNGAHTCGIAAFDGGVWCWGNNAHAQVGTGGSGAAVPTPFRITKGGVDSGVDAIALGAEHSCALKDGGVKCWGRNDSGQIGDNQTDTAFQPLQVTNLVPASATKAIAAGGKHSCAITSTDTVKCWGLNDHGQLGNNSTTLSKMPVDVPGLSNVVELALGGQHSCALTGGGAVWCWGANTAGALGDGTQTDRLVPVAVTGLPANVTEIAAGGGETCAIAAGALYCWGKNSSGQVGDGTTSAAQTVPFAIPGAGANTAAVTVGTTHACLRTTTGLSKCWGENGEGELGDGTTVDLYGPFLPDPPQNVTATAGDGTATVTWDAPTSDGGFPIASYTITPSGSGAPMTVTMPGTLEATFSGLTNGTAYSFTVKATNSVGASRTATSNSVTPAGLPGAPLSIAGAPQSSSTAAISWGAAAPNGSAVTSYTAVASPGGRTATVSGTRTTAVVSGLTPGASYSFTVRAKNRLGSGPPSSAVAMKLPKSRTGYMMLGANGTVYPFGDSPHLGGAVYANWFAGTHAVAITARADGTGYWIVDSIGGVRAFGTAKYLGQHPRLNAGESVSTLAATPTGKGYWLFTNRGRAVAYGDAHFLGDMSRVRLNGPVIASSATPTGKGYFMVASDGGVFTFGDARFKGSTGNIRLHKPVVGLSPTPTNGGYWLVAADGGVFAFGDAPFRGSMGAVRLSKPVNGLVPFGNGYLMVASDGGVFDFSNKPFLGSLGARPPAVAVIGIAAFST